MKVRDILEIIPRGTVVRILQTPIRALIPGDPVERQYADVTTLEQSGQNYLEFAAVKLEQSYGILTITCTANPEQERKTIAAFYANY